MCLTILGHYTLKGESMRHQLGQFTVNLEKFCNSLMQFEVNLEYLLNKSGGDSRLLNEKLIFWRLHRKKLISWAKGPFKFLSSRILLWERCFSVSDIWGPFCCSQRFEKTNDCLVGQNIFVRLIAFIHVYAKSPIPCSNLTIETLEQDVKYVQS